MSDGFLTMPPTLYDVALRIGRFPPIYPYLHLLVVLTRYYFTITYRYPQRAHAQRSSRIFITSPGKHTQSQYYIKTLYLYIETRPSYSRSNDQLPVFPCHHKTPPLVTRQSPAPAVARLPLSLIRTRPTHNNKPQDNNTIRPVQRTIHNPKQ